MLSGVINSRHFLFNFITFYCVFLLLCRLIKVCMLYLNYFISENIVKFNWRNNYYHRSRSYKIVIDTSWWFVWSLIGKKKIKIKLFHVKMKYMLANFISSYFFLLNFLCKSCIRKMTIEIWMNQGRLFFYLIFCKIYFLFYLNLVWEKLLNDSMLILVDLVLVWRFFIYFCD